MRKSLQSIADRLFRLLLRMLPLEFRWDYEREIIQVFRDQRSDPELVRSRAASVLLWFRTAGGVALTALREQLDILCRDVSFAFRLMRKNPKFSVAAVVVLALVIGANTAVFAVVRGVLLKPLPYRNGDQLVLVEQIANDPLHSDLKFSVPEIVEYRQGNRTLEGMAEAHSMMFTLLGHGDPLRVYTGVVSANFFPLMGVRALHGRTFEKSEDQAGADPVLVLGYDFFQRAFGGNPRVIGDTVEMNDRRHTIVGVLPPLPQYPEVYDVYMPTSACPIRSNPATWRDRSLRMMNIFGRLKRGASAEQARADLNRVNEQHQSDDPDSRGAQIRVKPIHEGLTAKARPTVLFLFASTAFVLLIVTANMANLLLARLMSRAPEIAIRTALGSGSGRLLRQLVTENLVLTLCGGVLGLLVAFASRGLLVAFASRFTARGGEITIDGPVMLFALLVSVAVAAIIGLIPAFLSGSEIFDSLKRAGRWSARARKPSRLRNGLITVQIAVSLVLLVSTGLMVRSWIKLNRIDPGFETDNVLSLRLYALDYNKARLLALRDRLLEGIDHLPNVRSAAMASNAPLYPHREVVVPVVPERKFGSVTDGPAAVRFVSPAYFNTLGIAILSGTDFPAGESRMHAIVSRSLARRYWDEKRAIGQRITADGGKNWFTVVGVVADARESGLVEGIRDQVYLPFDHSMESAPNLLIRTGSDPTAEAEAIRDVIRKLDSKMPVSDVLTLGQLRRDSLASSAETTLLLVLFTVLALTLSATGLSGVMALIVHQRSQEISIRSAFGATRIQVLAMLLRQMIAPVSAGLILGLTASAATSAGMSALVFEVKPTDLVAYSSSVLLFLGVILISCVLPVRRAFAQEPVAELRNT